MSWCTVLILALAISQVPAELVTPDFVENVIKVEEANNRIVSGWAAYPGQHPHQISIRMVSAFGLVSGCGGSIVSREWAISAAHCTALQVTLVIRAGLISLTTPQYIFETQEYYNYPTYDNNLPGVVQINDVAIIKLQRPVAYTRVLQPIRIQSSADAFRNYDREVVIASGFGRTWTDGATSEVLNWVYLRAISNPNCQQIFGTTLINSNAICAGFYNVTSQSTCQGDSGGPLIHVDSDGTSVLIGIASFVAGGSFGCHSGIPAGFIRPGPFLPWLEEVTGIDFENLVEEEEIPSTTEPAPSTTVPTTTPSTTTTTTTTPSTTTLSTTTPSTTTEYVPSTTEYVPTTTESIPTTVTTTTSRPSTTTTPAPESEEESSSEEEEDPEMAELLKKLIIKVKVKVQVNNKLKKKVKVKCIDKI